MMQAVDLYGIIEKSYDFSSPDYYARSERVLAAPIERLADAIGVEYRLRYYSELCQAIAARPAEDRRELRSRMRDCINLGTVETTPGVIAVLAQHLEYFEHVDFPYGVELVYRCLAGTHANLQEGAQFERYFRRSIDMQRRLGYTRMLAQSLGGLGAIHKSRGDIDSMHVCWNEGLQLATEYRMPDQAPRLLNFYARFYRQQGQTALAHDMLRNSVALADEYRAGYYRQRFVIELAEFYKSLNHWVLTKRLMDRAEVVVGSDFCSSMKQDLLLKLRAETLMAMGRANEASDIYQEIWDSFTGATHVGARALLLQSWAQGLVDNGEPKRAIELIDQGLRLQTSALMSLWLLRSQASLDLHELAQCEDALDQFTSFARLANPTPYADWLVHDALRIDVSIARGDSTSAWRYAAIGLERFILYLSRTDASVDGYLTISRAGRFRVSLHALVAKDPFLGYGAALFWSESSRFLGSPHAVERSASDERDPRDVVESTFRKAAEHSRASMAHLRGMHLAYAIVGDDVFRWAVTPDGVAQEKLALDATALRKLVSDACQELAPYAGKRPASSLEEINRLSSLLLPALPAPGTCILVTPDAWLGAFPFEVLNVGRGHYTALLANHDVAYLRPGSASKVPSVVGPPLIFVSPEARGEIMHRFPFQPTLLAASEEAVAVRSALPGARLLTGEQATRKALLSSWKTSGLVYVIGHVLRDPEAPYMVMIPATPTGDARESAYVEVSDIRSTDLSRCGLIVLSGCSSGLPYADEGAAAPSLAQACIDAGAKSVVHTFWDIEDLEASRLMTDFINRRREGITPIRALAEAKRARMQSADAGNFEWASYAILVNSAELVTTDNGASVGRP